MGRLWGVSSLKTWHRDDSRERKRTGQGSSPGLKASASGKARVLDHLLLPSPIDMSVASTFCNPLIKAPGLLIQLQAHLSTFHTPQSVRHQPVRWVDSLRCWRLTGGAERRARNTGCSAGQPPQPTLLPVFLLSGASGSCFRTTGALSLHQDGEMGLQRRWRGRETLRDSHSLPWEQSA